MIEFVAGERWTYRTPAGFEASRLVIGAVVAFGESEKVICAAVLGAPNRAADGAWERVVIPFLPFSQAAFEATVVAQDGVGVVPPAFRRELDAWAADPRGLRIFTVPFDGFASRLIARQMAQIVGPIAEAT